MRLGDQMFRVIVASINEKSYANYDRLRQEKHTSDVPHHQDDVLPAPPIPHLRLLILRTGNKLVVCQAFRAP